MLLVRNKNGVLRGSSFSPFLTISHPFGYPNKGESTYSISFFSSLSNPLHPNDLLIRQLRTGMEEVRDEPGPHSSLTERIDDDDDDQPTLSAQALEALREFLDEQNRAPVADDEAAAAGNGVTSSSEVALLAEDWRLSQFWYDPDTAETVAREVLSLCGPVESPSVACIACPTLYAYLKKIDPSVPAQLLEYDKRFEQYGSEFTFYDYNQPEELPSSLKNAYQIVVADPPYLSKECLEKVTQTISFLMRPGKSYLLLLTGGVQKDRAAELLDLYPCGFRPRHSSKLGNEFLLFTNYDPGMRLGGWERDQ